MNVVSFIILMCGLGPILLLNVAATDGSVSFCQEIFFKLHAAHYNFNLCGLEMIFNDFYSKNFMI